MLLHEMFDKKAALSKFDDDVTKNNKNHDTETSFADMIITQFENGDLTYDQAKQQLQKKNLDVWIHELNMAAELMKDKTTSH